ncbi:hypothetical protein CASFOL_020535 [Castilleja foliolosa]|uniref:Bifunctional inhibitor/plant lipid transfer protein/seed storage helical domain-containing protein n=1 Tax=Castilleja foliolosa TaxID=1961234 RepID=A0ABD3D1W1_9LAMI
MMKVVICILVLALVAAPRANGQCPAYVSANWPCLSGANPVCCSFLQTTTGWGTYEDLLMCVCRALHMSDIPVTYLNDCGVVQGSVAYC